MPPVRGFATQGARCLGHRSSRAAALYACGTEPACGRLIRFRSRSLVRHPRGRGMPGMRPAISLGTVAPASAKQPRRAGRSGDAGARSGRCATGQNGGVLLFHHNRRSGRCVSGAGFSLDRACWSAGGGTVILQEGSGSNQATIEGRWADVPSVMSDANSLATSWRGHEPADRALAA